MSKVTIYQYILLNTGLNEPRKARRWGTREAIEGLKGAAEILDDTATEVASRVPQRRALRARVLSDMLLVVVTLLMRLATEDHVFTDAQCPLRGTGRAGLMAGGMTRQ